MPIRIFPTKPYLVLPVVLALILCAAFSATAGPYAPAAGEPGSTAISKDDPTLQAWATGYTNYLPGDAVNQVWQTPEKGLGPAQGSAYDVVVLGRGGSITMLFDPPLQDGDDFDLAVFENAFDDNFLELAWVEVSSNGQDFARFPSISLTPSPVPGFGGLDPTDVHNLAGKYRQGWATPFDFQDLAVTPQVQEGILDLSSVSHVRIIDIVGDGTATDSQSRPIYDPYPTTGSAGFDLDAVAGRYPALQPSANTPPQAPALLTPNGTSAITAVLATGPFSDPDEGDSHSSTRYQIALDTDFEEMVLDTISTAKLLSLSVPPLALTPDTDYHWRARHHDRSGAASSWAEALAFRTSADAADHNHNGRPDDQELSAEDSSVDLNGDGIPDFSQACVTYAPLRGPEGLTALEAGSEFIRAEIASVDLLLPDDNAPETVLAGAAGWLLAVDADLNSQTEVTLHFESPIPTGAKWLRHGATDGWSAFPAEINGNMVVLTLQDGGPGDADGVANGAIVHQGALAYETKSPPDGASSGISGSGGCVAGAAADLTLALLAAFAAPWILRRLR